MFMMFLHDVSSFFYLFHYFPLCFIICHHCSSFLIIVHHFFIVHHCRHLSLLSRLFFHPCLSCFLSLSSFSSIFMILIIFSSCVYYLPNGPSCSITLHYVLSCSYHSHHVYVFLKFSQFSIIFLLSAECFIISSFFIMFYHSLSLSSFLQQFSIIFMIFLRFQ